MPHFITCLRYVEECCCPKFLALQACNHCSNNVGAGLWWSGMHGSRIDDLVGQLAVVRPMGDDGATFQNALLSTGRREISQYNVSSAGFLPALGSIIIFALFRAVGKERRRRIMLKMRVRHTVRLSLAITRQSSAAYMPLLVQSPSFCLKREEISLYTASKYLRLWLDGKLTFMEHDR